MTDGDLHPQARDLVARIAASGLPPSYAVPPEQGRRIVVERARLFFGPVAPVGRSEDREVWRDGRAIPVRIHWPVDDAGGDDGDDGDGPDRGGGGRGDAGLPAIVYFHGGGWVLGSLDSHDHGARALCAAAGAVVVSVGYRRAPEHPFPAAAEDADAALRWAEAQAPLIGGDAARIAVAGDSSGGNLAAVAALAARERGAGSPVLQVLICPVLDARCDTPSYDACADAPFLSAEGMRRFWATYLAGGADAGRDWRASPMRASDLTGVAPALVIAAGIDPLRDEARAYAARLADAGVPVTLRVFERMPHGFLQAAAVLDGGRAAVELAAKALRDAFRRRT